MVRPRSTFDQELQKLQDEVLALGSMVEKAVIHSVEALKQRDQEAAREIIQTDQEINAKRFEIEDACLFLVASQQPVAKDLRLIAAVLEITTDLERMGDHAAGIAEINLMMGDDPLVKPLIDVPRMSQIGAEMLRESMDAFIRKDVKIAQKVANRDDEVDQLYNQVYNELLAVMLSNPHTISGATYLLWVAHNLERIADRATNICERVIFTVTGEMQEINV
ncbi:MAG: phosphate signaling complex protein PhoU [Chloroflexota bacterium]|nr:phosphate signaling complex protein PhoU [Chloroflexota bacterium]